MTLGRVVLLDPDVALARTLTRILREAGYDVAAIARAEELGTALSDAPSDLLLVDLMAMGPDAPDAIAPILQAAAPRPRVLMVSSLPPSVETFRQLGASPSHYIAKPFRVHELLARLRAELPPRAPAPDAARTSAVVMADVTTGLTAQEVFQLLVRRVAQGLRIPRCSIVLARRGGTRGTVVAAYENPDLTALEIELARYPEILRAMETGDVVHVPDAASDPLYDAVRAGWHASGGPPAVRSVIAIRFDLKGEPAGVFFLRTSEADAPLDESDVAFARQIVEAAVRTLERIASESGGLARA
jgi:DNA-binding response OmpR family regulator